MDGASYLANFVNHLAASQSAAEIWILLLIQP
jgi:hypothetical protein